MEYRNTLYPLVLHTRAQVCKELPNIHTFGARYARYLVTLCDFTSHLCWLCSLAGLPCKVPRLMTPGGLHDLPPISEEKEEEKDEDGVRDSSAVADSSQFASDRATRTPVRHSTSERIVTKGRIISMATRGSGDGGSPSALREALPVRPYSPPSPYALSPSPSPSSSPPPSPRLTQEHKRRRIYPEASGNMGAHGSVSMSQGSPQRRGVATPTATLTPKRRAESATKTFPTTPDSGSKYRRVLVPSQTSEGENGLPHRSPRSLMERFEATYRYMCSTCMYSVGQYAVSVGQYFAIFFLTTMLSQHAAYYRVIVLKNQQRRSVLWLVQASKYKLGCHGSLSHER